jgi:hypothetical protein
MKLLDGINIERSNVEELIAALTKLAMQPRMVIVTDENGVPIERIKLFCQKLSDSSTVQTIEIHFEK